MSKYIEIIDSYNLDPMLSGNKLVAMSDIFIHLKKEGFCVSDYTDDFINYLIGKINVQKDSAYTTYILIYIKHYKNTIVSEKPIMEKEKADIYEVDLSEQIQMDISMFTKKTLDKDFCKRLGITDEE